jgi:hypothetical protein
MYARLSLAIAALAGVAAISLFAILMDLEPGTLDGFQPSTGISALR